MKKDLKLYLLRGLVVLMVFCAFSVPQPVHAKSMILDPVNAALEFSYRLMRVGYMSTVTYIHEYNAALTTAATVLLVPEWFAITREAINSTFTGMTSGTEIQTRGLGKLADVVSDTSAKNALLASEERLALKQVTPPNEILCKAMQLSNLAQITKPFTNSVSEQVQRSLAYMGRGSTDDMDGMLYAADMEKGRCELGTGSSLDGYELLKGDCTKGENIKVGDLNIIDADVMLHKAMGGRVALEIPPVKKRTMDNGVTVLVPDPTTPAQKMWLAGYYGCIQMQGPRISALWGDNMDSPSGSTQRTMFEHALSRQTVYNEACSDLLAYYTKPNNTEYPHFMETQNYLCENARRILSDKELNADYGGCAVGLSLYQAEKLQHRICKAEGFTLEKRSIGTTDKNMPDGMIDCAASMLAWESSVASRHGRLVDAVVGQMKIKQSWPTNLAMGRGTNRPTYAKAKGSKKKKTIHKVNTPPTYTPVLPEVIAQ